MKIFDIVSRMGFFQLYFRAVEEVDVTTLNCSCNFLYLNGHFTASTARRNILSRIRLFFFHFIARFVHFAITRTTCDLDLLWCTFFLLNLSILAYLDIAMLVSLFFTCSRHIVTVTVM